MSPIAAALKDGRDISICQDCAEANGGVWPKDHVATWHTEWPCHGCLRNVALCALSDWEWPGYAGRKMQERREL